MVDVDEYPRQQLFIHPEKPSPEKFDPVENSDRGHFKPDGGLWTSSYQNETCGWLDWMRAEQWYMYGDDADVWLLEIEDTPDLYVIDSQTDAKALLEVYERTDGPLADAGLSRHIDLDYEEIATDYDGIWLTANGLTATRFEPEFTTFYGWDCECTLWLDFPSLTDDPEKLDIEIVQ